MNKAFARAVSPMLHRAAARLCWTATSRLSGGMDSPIARASAGRPSLMRRVMRADGELRTRTYE